MINIRLFRRQLYAQVSDEDSDLIGFRWTLCNGYVRRWCGGGYIWLHHEVLDRMGLVIPPYFEPDHKDRNPLNNQRENLRIVDRSQNTFNQSHFLKTFTPYVASYGFLAILQLL